MRPYSTFHQSTRQSYMSQEQLREFLVKEQGMSEEEATQELCQELIRLYNVSDQGDDESRAGLLSYRGLASLLMSDEVSGFVCLRVHDAILWRLYTSRNVAWLSALSPSFLSFSPSLLLSCPRTIFLCSG